MESNEKGMRKFSRIVESLEQPGLTPITFERCRAEIERLLAEDGHDTGETAADIDAMAEQIMKEFNFTFALLERRIFGWKKNKI